MRLLEYDNDGKFSLTEFYDDIPRYAILSHTWGPDALACLQRLTPYSPETFDRVLLNT